MEDINPLEEIIEKEEQRKILIELSKIDGLQEFLRTLMARDMRLHFTCPKEQQDLARGAYFRTEYLAKMIKQHSIDNK